MCFNTGGRPQLAPVNTPAPKAPLAPELPGEDPRNVGQGRRKLRVDLTQPKAGIFGSGLKIPM